MTMTLGLGVYYLFLLNLKVIFQEVNNKCNNLTLYLSNYYW